VACLKKAVENQLLTLGNRPASLFGPQNGPKTVLFCPCEMLAAFRIQTFLAVLVVLNLIGLSIAAYFVMRRK
jgi:hypothetical protein